MLGRPAYWWRQEELNQSILRNRVTLVPAGHGVGKTFWLAGTALYLWAHNPGCRVLATAPSNTQLEEVFWSELTRAYNGARHPLGGRMLRDPLKLDGGNGWDILAYSTQKPERMQGHHRGQLIAIVDEAAGMEPAIVEAIDGLNPSTYILVGNPTRADGPFFDRCLAFEEGRSSNTNLVRIPALESPDIHLERSLRGMADRTWLDDVRSNYGEGSLYWTSRVLARFPGSSADQVFPRAWLDLAGKTIHKRSGPARTGIDIGGGGGNDRSVVLTRDDTGILALAWSSSWDLKATAEEAARHVREFGVEPHRVVYDKGGIGHDFANRLQAAGVHNARPYLGGTDANSPLYSCLRARAAWLARQRLDPDRMVPVVEGGKLEVRQPPFAIREEWLRAGLREELGAIRYRLDSRSRIELEAKEEMVKRLKRSPDLADAFTMTFAYPG